MKKSELKEIIFKSIKSSETAFINSMSKIECETLTQDIIEPISEAINKNAIEEAKKTLKEAGYIIGCLWSDEDITHTCEEHDLPTPTKEQIKIIIERIEKYHDAEYGINWDFIRCHCEQVINK